MQKKTQQTFFSFVYFIFFNTEIAPNFSVPSYKISPNLGVLNLKTFSYALNVKRDLVIQYMI